MNRLKKILDPNLCSPNLCSPNFCSPNFCSPNYVEKMKLVNRKYFHNMVNVNDLKFAFENNLFESMKNCFDVLILNERRGIVSCREYFFDEDGNNPLFWATNVGNLELVMMLVEKYAFPLDYQNFCGSTALGIAVMGGFVDIVCFLLKKGANANICNLKKESPLHFAACFNFTEICDALLRNGAWIEAEDENGETALHWAVREEYKDVTQLLLREGANADHPNEDGCTPREMTELDSTKELHIIFDSYAGTDTKYQIDSQTKHNLSSSDEISFINQEEKYHPKTINIIGHY